MMMFTLLYGTGNPAKLDSMRRSLSGTGIRIIGLRDMQTPPPAVPENGTTPLENARQKALAYYRAYGIPVFSCDSGLYFDGILPGACPPLWRKADSTLSECNMSCAFGK